MFRECFTVVMFNYVLLYFSTNHCKQDHTHQQLQKNILILISEKKWYLYGIISNGIISILKALSRSGERDLLFPFSCLKTHN